MDFDTWLTAWLRRHPMKPLSDQARARYTAEVMVRVKAATPAAAPAPAAPGRWIWPRLWMTAATALATGLIVVSLREPSLEFAAIVQEADQLAELEPLMPQEPIQTVDELSGELEMMDAVMLAESSPFEDDAWIEQTLQLLEALEEDLPASDDDSGDSWMDELELLDDSELAAS